MKNFFCNLNMRKKLISIFIITGLIPMICIGAISYFNARESLIKENYRSMELFRELTEAQFQDYFREKMLNGKTLAGINDIYRTIEIFQSYEKDSEEWLKGYNSLDRFLPTYVEYFGLNGIYITDLEGYIVYATEQLKGPLEVVNSSNRNFVIKAIDGQ